MISVFSLTSKSSKIGFRLVRPVNTPLFALHAVLLLSFWLVLSGFFDAFHIGLGILSVSGVLIFNKTLLQHRYYQGKSQDSRVLHYGLLARYFVFLFASIIWSSLKVAYLIVNPAIQPRSAVFRFRVNLPGMHAKVLLANSITLTPGTVTLDITDGDVFLVHALMHPNDPVCMDHSLAHALSKVFGILPEQVISEEQTLVSQSRSATWTST
jgi:multicomponent Na+:H+ antiporter subunit E